MPFQLSPGVAVVEKDLTAVVPTVSTSAGGFAGSFQWGPIEDPIRVSSEDDLVAIFGKPNNFNFDSFFTAANFLAYNNNLLVCRADSTNAKNAVTNPLGSINPADIQILNGGSGYTTADMATSVVVTFPGNNDQGTGPNSTIGQLVVATTGPNAGKVTSITLTRNLPIFYGTPSVVIPAPIGGGTPATARVAKIDRSGVKIKNLSNYQESFFTGTASYGSFAAKFAGTRGNGLRITLIDSTTWATAPNDIKALFPKAPGTSTFASKKGISADEIHIVVQDNGAGSFSGGPNSVLETFAFVSKLADAVKEDGTNNYYKTVINASSKYLWWMRHQSSLYSVWYNTIVGASTLVFTAKVGATSAYITCNDNTALAGISAYKAFYDAALDKSTQQIIVSNTTLNNGVYTVSSIEPIIVSEVTTGYKFNIVENLTAETDSSATITPFAKPSWGSDSSTVLATAGNKRMQVAKTVFTGVLSGGADDFTMTTGGLQNAYSVFANAEQYDISLLPLGSVSPTVAKYVVDNVAETRKDCIVFMSPRDVTTGAPILTTGSTATSAMIAWREATNIDSSYAMIDSGFKYQYDKYNDTYRWIPLNGDTAGLCARTDFVADPWYSPGGFSRGQIKNIVKLGFSPTQTDRDVLYTAGINPVVSFRGQGVILYGDKTMLSAPSAFDRINVRRLFIVLEKSIARAARYQLFEFNDSFTRAQFRNLVEPFLRDVQGRRGIVDFRVKCDETNNTGQIIDTNQFVADIFIKPNRSINFITLNFIAARSSVNFEEIGA